MNGLQIFAFVILPAIVAALGWGAGWLHMRSLRIAERRERKQQMKG